RQAFEKYFQIARYDNAEWSESECWLEATKKLAENLDVDKKQRDQFELLTPTCAAPYLGDACEEAEIAAIKRTPFMKFVESKLARQLDGRGRKASDRFPIAVFQQGCFEKNVSEIKLATNKFHGSDQHRDYAYDYPCDAKAPTTRVGVADAIRRILGRNAPVIPMIANIAAMRELARLHPDGRIGRYCAIDGTAVEAFALQKQAYSHAERSLISKETESTFKVHDGGLPLSAKKWRGYTLLTISCQKSTLPLVWMVVDSPRMAHVDLMLDILFKAWPECPMKYLCGDREFDNDKLARSLYERWGVDHVMISKQKEQEGYDKGVPVCPYCSTDESPVLMVLRGRENFCFAEERMNPKQKSRLAAPRGVRIPFSNEKIRWECPLDSCDAEEIIYARDRPAQNNYLPRAGESEASALRYAILARRNTAESVFSNLKRRYAAGGGCLKARWVKRRVEMEWILGMTLLGITLQRLVHLNGDYETQLQHAIDNDLVKSAAIKRFAKGYNISHPSLKG
ncbi:MAG: hypothetical protein ACRDKE_00935, partial [Solirubrobacterales bacterium]